MTARLSCSSALRAMHRCSSVQSSRLHARSASRRYTYIYIRHAQVHACLQRVFTYMYSSCVLCACQYAPLCLRVRVCIQVVDFLRRQIHRDSVVRRPSIQSRVHAYLSFSLSLSFSLEEKYTCAACITDSCHMCTCVCVYVCASYAVCVSP